MRVTIQYQETRKPHAWKNAFVALVLYADREIILVRGCGSYSSFHANGDMRGVGYNPKHPHAKGIPARRRRWRIQPSGLPKKTRGIEDKAALCLQLACALLPEGSAADIEDQGVAFMLLPEASIVASVERLSTQPERRREATRETRPGRGTGSKGSPSRSAAPQSASKPRPRSKAPCRQSTPRRAS